MTGVYLFVDRKFELHVSSDVQLLEATWSPMAVDETDFPDLTVLKLDGAGRLYEQTYRRLTPDEGEVWGGPNGRIEGPRRENLRKADRLVPVTYSGSLTATAFYGNRYTGELVFELRFENGRCVEKRLVRQKQPDPNKAEG